MLSGGQRCFLKILFDNESFDNIAINTRETQLLVFLLKRVDEVGVKLTVKEQNVVAFSLSGIDVCVLGNGIGCVERDDVFVLVSLFFLDELFVFVKRKELAFSIFE